MKLTEQQQDALTELINIAFSRTAGSLSSLTGQHVYMEVPSVTIAPINEMFTRLNSLMHGKVATVRQLFSGPITGNALLMMDFKSAITLTGLLTDEEATSELQDIATRE